MKGEGGGRQSLKHIDGDVPKCMRNKGEDDEMKSKKTENARGGGRQRFRHFDGDVPMCMRNIDEENGLKSKEKEKSSRSSNKVKKEAERQSKGTSGSSKSTHKTTSEPKGEKYITFLHRATTECEVAKLK